MKKTRSAAIAITILSILLASACTPRTRWVRVEGNKFIDPQGNELIFRGLCFSDPVKLVREGQWNERYFAEAAGWGANVVRFAVHPTNLNAMGWDRTFEAMDQGVAWAKQHGMYVIMDWHSIGNLKEERYTSPMYNTTKEETFRFWRTVAQRYKDEPAVALYELFNEPTVTAEGVGSCTWTEWKELQEQLIDTVRTYNPNAVCLCAGFNWAYDLTPVAKEPVARGNIAYVSHPYPMKRSEPWEEQWEKDFGYVADTYPVICTEIGYCLADEPGAHIPVMSTDVYGEHITKYFEQKGISFTVWCFDTSWAPMLISDWDFTPTTQGRFFKAYLQRKRFGIGFRDMTPEEEELDRQYAATLLQAGAEAPAFSLDDLDGKPVSLDDFRGKTVVLVFWASWCPDCRAELPQLKEMYAAADPEKVRFVSVSFDRDFDTLKQFVADNGVPGIQLFDPAGKKDSAVGAAYGVQWIPSLYLINPEGKVAVSTVIASNIAAALTGRKNPGALLPGNLCTDESCAL